MKSLRENFIFTDYIVCVLMYMVMVTPVFAESYTYDDVGRLTGVTYDDGSTISYTYDNAGNRLQLTSAAAEPDIMVAPASHDFGTVDVGSVSTSQTITISNVGTADLVISNLGLSGADAAQFSLSTGTCASLSPTISPASNCTVTVNFSPFPIGAKSATLGIASNDADTPNLDVALTGQGVTANIAVIPATHDFGSVDVGSTSTPQTITISNTGSADLVISSIGLTGADAAEFGVVLDTCASLSPTIVPASTCTVSVTFSPISAGAKAAMLSIVSNDVDTPSLDVTLTGVGVAVPVADITVSPANADFGSITVNASSPAQVFTVSNIGSVNLVVASMTITGVDFAEFSVVEGTCANLTPTLTPSENCTLEIQFSPTAPGTKTASLAITSNDPDTPTINLPLSGTGTGVANDAPASFALVFPADGATDLPTSIPLIWKKTTDSDGDTVSYRVIFCDNPAFSGCVAQTVALNLQDMILYGSIAGPFTGLFIMGLVFTGSRKTRLRKQLAFIAFMVFVSGLVACGGGGGSDPDDPVLPTAGADEKQLDITGLASATTYHWKVTADDGKGGLTDSEIRSFTTQ